MRNTNNRGKIALLRSNTSFGLTELTKSSSVNQLIGLKYSPKTSDSLLFILLNISLFTNGTFIRIFIAGVLIFGKSCFL